MTPAITANTINISPMCLIAQPLFLLRDAALDVDNVFYRALSINEPSKASCIIEETLMTEVIAKR